MDRPRVHVVRVADHGQVGLGVQGEAKEGPTVRTDGEGCHVRHRRPRRQRLAPLTPTDEVGCLVGCRRLRRQLLAQLTHSTCGTNLV